MRSVRKRENILLHSVVTLAFAASIVGLAAAQHKNNPPAPKPSAPHASAPASHPSTSHPPSRPSTPTRGPSGARPGTTAGSRPGTNIGKSGAGTGRPGTGVAGKTTGRPGTGVGGRNGTNANSKMGGAGGKGGNGTVGRNVNRQPPGRQVSLKGGGSASLRPNGQIRSINRNGMHINHGLNGSRRIESTRNGARIVNTGKHSGYVQRAYVSRNGRTYVSRTTVVNHVTYTSVYRSYSYGGYCCYYGYHPAYYYGPAYYGWAYNPWPAPVAYGWGWGGSPWYGYYGGYFAPYPAYPSAAFWLTDYLISANLQAAYQARAAANAAVADDSGGNNQPADNGGGDQSQGNGNADQSASSGPVALSPEVKEAIAQEVKAQLAAEQAAAAKPDSGGGQPPAASSEEVPPALDPARRTFVVASDLAVTDSDGQECQLTEGDVISRTSDIPDENRNVTATISASKKGDCSKGKQVGVAVDDLQEMHNHFQEQLDNGMKELSSKQGSGGLPKAPDTKTVPSDVPPPAPDASAAKTLEDQQANADQVESQVVKEAFSQGS